MLTLGVPRLSPSTELSPVRKGTDRGTSNSSYPASSHCQNKASLAASKSPPWPFPQEASSLPVTERTDAQVTWEHTPETRLGHKVPEPRSGAPVLDGPEAAFSICANTLGSGNEQFCEMASSPLCALLPSSRSRTGTRYKARRAFKGHSHHFTGDSDLILTRQATRTRKVLGLSSSGVGFLLVFKLGIRIFNTGLPWKTVCIGQSKMKGVPATPVKASFHPFGAIHSAEPSNTLLSSAANISVLQVPRLQQPPWLC